MSAARISQFLVLKSEDSDSLHAPCLRDPFGMKAPSARMREGKGHSISEREGIRCAGFMRASLWRLCPKARPDIA